MELKLSRDAIYQQLTVELAVTSLNAVLRESMFNKPRSGWLARF
jgi:hypothetical protein